jgi:hypothetical protein
VYRKSFFRAAALLLAAALALCAAQIVVSSELRATLDFITPNSLRGHVSFLASDLLEGRSTPSRGLDVAAEYVAAQFRRAALKPAGEDGYFQAGSMAPSTRNANPAAPPPEPVKLRNVIGVLRGSDPALSTTYVIVSAHYDPLGMRPPGEGDLIYNGANDDASGTVAVLEIAAALARLGTRPKRSIVFMTFAGEEKGLLGSRYYAAHPVFPVEKTVAAINLEQLGRTDDVTGPVISTAYVTGFDYSQVGPILETAGKLTGVTIAKHPENNDTFFTASDNLPLAAVGIPAHTISVGFIFPDYHKVGDEWQKLDYDNMAKVVRAVALGVYMLANGDEPPRWNPNTPQADRYRKVRETPAAKP